MVTVGQPTAPAELHKGIGWFIRGCFWHTPRGDYWWEAGKAAARAAAQLRKAGVSDAFARRIGLSVEGSRQQRLPDGTVLKASIFNVAVTHNPVNTDERIGLELTKALGSGDAAPMIREDLEGARRSRHDRINRIVVHLAEELKKRHGLSHESAIKYATSYVRRRLAAARQEDQ